MQNKINIFLLNLFKYKTLSLSINIYIHTHIFVPINYSLCTNTIQYNNLKKPNFFKIQYQFGTKKQIHHPNADLKSKQKIVNLAFSIIVRNAQIRPIRLLYSCKFNDLRLDLVSQLAATVGGVCNDPFIIRSPLLLLVVVVALVDPDR